MLDPNRFFSVIVRLAWRDGGGVEVERGILVVRGRVVAFARHAVRDVPNPAVLVVVADALKGGAPADPLPPRARLG